MLRIIWIFVRSLILLPIIFVVAGLTWGQGRSSVAITNLAETEAKPLQVHNVSFPYATPSYAPPSGSSQLVIPAISLNANIENVGITNGAMGVPSIPQDVGWLDTGKVPGDTGNAVIDGHSTNASGKPAVFYTLNHLKVGDSIQVIWHGQTTHTFQVVDIATYSLDDYAARVRIFGASSERNLNLITCAGTWNQSINTYNSRLVIYSRLVS